MQERRRFVRIPESSQISYKVMPSAQSKDFLTKDLSQGGLRFYVHEFIPKNSFLRIRLILEKKVFSFEAVVKVAWIKEVPLSERYEIGVEFFDMPAETSIRLIDYIRENLKIY